MVVCARSNSGEGFLLELAGGPKELAHDTYVALVAAAEKEQWDAAPLVASVKKLVAETPELAGIGDVIVARIDDHRGELDEVPALLVTDPALPLLRATATTWDARTTKGGANKESKGKGKGKVAPTLVLNLRCPSVSGALTLATHDVWLASFLVLRLAVPPVPVADGASAMMAWTSRSSS